MEIFKVANQGLHQTVKIRHKHHFAQIYVLTIDCMRYLDQMAASNVSDSPATAEQIIVLNILKSRFFRKVQQIFEISDTTLKVLQTRPLRRNQNNRWRYGVIRSRASKIVKLLQTGSLKN